MRIRTCQKMTTRNKKMTKTKVTTMTLSTRTPKTSTNKATLIQFALLAVLAVVAWMPLTVTAFSAHSTFTSRTSAMSAATKRRAFTRRYSLASSANTLTMYDASRDPPSSPELNAWHVLGKTEQWISATLAASDTGMGNPYSRKEVSYACETHKDAALILANIFRHLREARELGEAHGVVEEDRAQDLGTCQRRATRAICSGCSSWINSSNSLSHNLLFHSHCSCMHSFDTNSNWIRYNR